MREANASLDKSAKAWKEKETSFKKQLEDIGQKLEKSKVLVMVPHCEMQ